MKAIVCNTCLKTSNLLIEVRTIKGRVRSKKAHFCPACLHKVTRNLAYGPRTIDIPLDPKDPEPVKEGTSRR